MDDPNITMEEYIRLEEEKTRRRGQVYNWETAMYGKIWYDEDVHYLISFGKEFPVIVYKDALTSEQEISSEPTHKVDEYHNDMPLIYYVEGHSLHLGRPEFALITALEVIFRGRLLTCLVDDSLFGLVENLEAWNVFPLGEHVWTQLYDSIKNVVVKHSDTHYLGLKKDRNYVPTYTLTRLIFAFQRLQFNEDLYKLKCDFVESLYILFQDLVDPYDLVEDIANEYLVNEELKLCLEEEMIRSKQEKRIQQEKRLRLEEEKMLRLEEEKMLQIAKVKKESVMSL
nr:phospholipase-like protein [Tanacetum cinerariifolium]